MRDVGAAILRAIIDEPGEDVHRLAYADWLEDNGQAERAEFIRLELELARIDSRFDHALRRYASEKDHDDSWALITRRGELFRANADRWAFGDSLPELGGMSATLEDGRTVMRAGQGGRVDLAFARGFVAEAWCEIGKWEECGREMARRHPIQKVRLAGKWPTECRPDLWTFVDSGRFGQGSGPPHYGPHESLPSFLIEHMPPELEIPGSRWPPQSRFRASAWSYKTRDAAMEALSAACIDWARSSRTGGR